MSLITLYDFWRIELEKRDPNSHCFFDMCSHCGGSGQIVGSSIDANHNIKCTYKNCQFYSAGKPIQESQKQESLKQGSKTHEKANCSSFKNLKDEKVQTDRKHSNLSGTCTQTNLEDNLLNLSYLNYRGAKMVNKAA